MKNQLLKIITLVICISAMILGSAMVVQAEEMKEVVTGEHNITISPEKRNAGYVYVSAQVPNGWSGEIRVNFYSRSTGKDHSCSMSYIENEYHTGLWLPEGSYQVSAELPQDDGLCQLKLQNPEQEILRVKNGDNQYLNILATETQDTDTPAEITEESVIPPKNQQDYQDLPTAATETAMEATEATEILNIEEVPEDGNLLTHIVRILAAILVIIVAVLTVLYLIHESSKQDSV